MAAKATVRGDREIIANMRRARAAVGGRNLDRNMRSALEPMKDRTVENAKQRRQPRQPKGGHLDQGVVVVQHKSMSPLHKEYWISFRKRARKIAHLVEYGTAPHAQPRRGIMHPGARPYPFFRPAFETTKHQVVKELSQEVWRRINQALIGARR